MSVLLYVALTDVARVGAPWWVEWLLVIALLAVGYVLALYLWPRLKRGNWLYKRIFGPPEFGALGGPDQRLFRLVLKSYGAIRLNFRPEDEAFLKDQQNLDEQLIERLYRQAYEKAVSEGKFDPAGLDWTTAWDKLLGRRVDGVSYADTIRSRTPVWGTLGPRIAVEYQLLLPLAALYSLLMAWLVARAASNPDTAHLLVVAQVGLLGGLFTSLIVYVNHVYMFAQLKAYGDERMKQAEREVIPEELREIWDAHVDRYEGRVVQPTSFEYDPPFVRAAGGYFRRLATAVAFLNAVEVLGFGVIVALVGIVTSDRSVEALFSYCGRVALGLVALPALMFLGSSLGFALMQDLRRFASLLVAAAVLAVAPQLIALVLTGSLAGGYVGLISSVVTALLGAMGTAIAEAVRKPAATMTGS